MKNRKKRNLRSNTKGSFSLWKKNQKLKKFWFFSKKSIFLHLNLNSTCSKLSFEVHNIGFAQNFQIFNFLPINFPSMTNFIDWPLAANIVLKRDCFGYKWTAKDQNIYLWSSFTIYVAFQLHSWSLASVWAQSALPHYWVLTLRWPKTGVSWPPFRRCGKSNLDIFWWYIGI